MANPHPTPRLENLRPPWPPGTSGNPAGYSRGRRISDTFEGLIDELALQREFGTTAIAMALGKKHWLKQQVTDPETGEDIWVEQKPDLAWFQMIVQRIEPPAQQVDAVARLSAILDDLDREEGEEGDPGQAAESPGRSPSDPCHVHEPAESTAAPFQDVPAQAGSGQVALQVGQADLPAGDPGTTAAVERPSGRRGAPILRGLRGGAIRPGRRSGSRRSLTPSSRDCSRETSAAWLPGTSGLGRDGQAGSAGRLAEIAVVAGFLLVHQAVVLDDPRAGGHVVEAGAGAADEQHGSLVVQRQRPEPLQGLDIQVMGRLIPDPLAGGLVADAVAAGQAGAHPGTPVTRSTFPVLFPVLAPERPQAGAHPGTLVTRSTFPVLFPVLAPERPPDGQPAPTPKT